MPQEGVGAPASVVAGKNRPQPGGVRCGHDEITKFQPAAAHLAPAGPADSGMERGGPPPLLYLGGVLTPSPAGCTLA